MITRRSWILLAAILGPASAGTIATGPGACLGPDSVSQGSLSDLNEWMSDAKTDTVLAHNLTRAGLVSVDTSQIKLISDSTKCRCALNALIATDTWTHPSPTAAYLVSVGHRYTVTNSNSAGEWSGVHWVFDTAFTYKGNYLY
jgi:hypothetical protein